MLRTASLAALLVSAAPLAAQVTPTPARPDSASPALSVVTARADSVVRRDSAITPAADQPRGVDAEIRSALYELLEDRYIPALSRLRWLAASPVALSGADAGARAYRGREDMLFLLAQTYYRLGMDSAFRATATQLGSGGTRYGRLLRTQLLMDAYRHGDFARAISLATEVDASDRGLGSLVAGLSAYQTGDFAGAGRHFAAAQGSGGTYGQYAQYMAALTTLRADTSQRATALASLEALAAAATGELQDQVRLTAAELAYEHEQYDVAARLAGQVSAAGGLGAQALLTRAWSLYKANDIAGSAQAFQDYATRYPQLPERDESRLMAGQAMLQLGRTAEAASIFRTVADSATVETQSLQAQAQASMNDAARALVRARAAGLLFINDPANGKTIALSDAAGSERQVLVAAFSDTAQSIVPTVSTTEIIALDDVSRRVDEIAPSTALPRRVVFAPASATKNSEDFARRSQALYAADVDVIVAQQELAELMESQRRQILVLRALQERLTADAGSLTQLETRLAATRDSLARLATALDAAGTRIRQLFVAQLNATRLIANENRAAIDSARTALAGAQGSSEYQLFEIEAQTATSYLAVADIIEQGIGTAVGRHPVFAKRDSMNARSQQLGTLLADTRNALGSAQQALATEITRLESGSDRAAALQARLAAAESRRATAENSVVAVVDAELRARANEMIAGLRRDREAAEFGSASASFFQALDSAGQGSATGATNSASAPPSASTRSLAAQGTPTASRDNSQPQQK
jgi:hypothetical protein